jgi:hypothetical protein
MSYSQSYVISDESEDPGTQEGGYNVYGRSELSDPSDKKSQGQTY